MANYTVTITETVGVSDKIAIDVVSIAFLIILLSTILTISVSTFLHLLHKWLDEWVLRRRLIATIVAGALLVVCLYILYLLIRLYQIPILSILK
jgi:hypothetical protein